MAYGCSQARSRTGSAAVTYATVVATRDPEPAVLGGGSNPCCLRDNAGSLSHCAAEGTPTFPFLTFLV